MSGKDNCDSTSPGAGRQWKEVSKKTFTWRIHNFNEVSTTPRSINAQKTKFDVDASPELPAMTWTLSLSHKFSSGDIGHDWEVWSLEEEVLSLNYFCSVKGQGEEQIPMYVASVSYNIRQSQSSGLSRNASGHWNLMHKSQGNPLGWNAFLVHRAFVLVFTVEFYRDPDDSVMRFMVNSWNKLHEHSTKSHFLEMLKSGHLSDIKIVANDGQTFNAHKLILKAGSEVFEAMFSHEMAESTTGVIILDDMSAPAVEFLLHFLYSSELLCVSVNEDEGNGDVVTLAEVLYLASKYGLKELLSHVENDIEKSCVEGNVIYLLKLCKLYSLNKGMKLIFDLVHKNKWNVVNEFVVSQL